MGVYKKFRGGYSHECAQAYYSINGTASFISVSVPSYKDTSGTSRNIVGIGTEGSSAPAVKLSNSCLPYFNLRPVITPVGLYESALGLTYDSSKTYYTSNEGATEADMSGYSAGDTITDNVFYCTYDVEDYSITSSISLTPSLSRAYLNTSKSRKLTLTISVSNTTADEITIKSIKFWNEIMIAWNTTCNVLKCAYYLAPSEYVTIPAGETGSVVAVFEFGEV
jgi:hypothetical protein